MPRVESSGDLRLHHPVRNGQAEFRGCAQGRGSVAAGGSSGGSALAGMQWTVPRPTLSPHSLDIHISRGARCGYSVRVFLGCYFLTELGECSLQVLETISSPNVRLANIVSLSVAGVFTLLIISGKVLILTESDLLMFFFDGFSF